ncbi:hypothetical protein LJR220_003367 [Bradyrhizobium sp. LjRoot220]|uniref:hypothetical protein n=1 Tax=Bradyrhizobium sp. LjRoot220 TaxID=3342284 RepID=UPI003ECC89B6
MNFHSRDTRILSPAQKAWETRRAKAAGHALQERQKAIEVEAAPSPLVDARMIEIALDLPDIACGRRRYVVLDIGPRTVRLFSAPSLIGINITREEFDRRAKPVKHNGAIVAGIIRRNIALADRVNDKAATLVLTDGGPDAVRALQVLR